MARPRRSAPAKQASRPDGPRSWAACLKPDTTRRGLIRLASRTVTAGLAVAIVSTLAHWTASGFVASGELGRLVAMKNTPQPEKAADAKRGGLDRGRLKSVIAGTAGPGGR